MRVYTAKQMQCALGALDLTSGAPVTGAFLTIAYNDPRVNVAQTVGGTLITSQSPSKLGTVTITQTAAAAANTALSELVNAGQRTGRPQKQPLLIKDFNGSTTWAMAEAVIQSMPAESFAADGTPTRVWTLLGLLEGVAGGSTEV